MNDLNWGNVPAEGEDDKKPEAQKPQEEPKEKK